MATERRCYFEVCFVAGIVVVRVLRPFPSSSCAHVRCDAAAAELSTWIALIFTVFRALETYVGAQLTQ